MNSYGQRLKQARAKTGLTQAEFGDKLGIKGSKIKDIETGRLKLTADIAELIGDFYPISGWWLLTGKGNMEPPPKAPPPISNTLSIPLVSPNAQAGKGNDISNVRFEIVETMTISKSLFKTPPTSNVRIIKVDGYSMVPTLYPDSYCIFDECGEFSTDGLYIINYGNELMVKLLQLDPRGSLHIKSTNPDYESWEISQEDQSNFRIIGKVLRIII
jgi:phage repressor protein C with HTH and peptisase S24 domain